MKYALLVLALAVPAQEGDRVLLRWKAPFDGPVAFKASLKATGTAAFDAAGIAEWAGEIPGAPPELPEKIKAFLGSLKVPESFGMTMILAPAGKDRLSVRLVQNASPLPAGDSPLEKLLKEMEGTVQLRGEIDAAGAVTSWWLQDNQKNLLATLCELPRHPVKPGDRWSLGVNLVSMGHGFIAAKAERINVARLVELRKGADGDTVAVVELVLSDRVEGEFVVGAEKPKPTTMSMSYAGRGEFSTARGTWLRFSGTFRTRASGVMKSDVAQELALEPLAAVPEALLKLR